MKIIIDGFGGDNAPIEILKGSALAVEQNNINVVMTGNKEMLKKIAYDNSINLRGIEFVDAKSVLPVSEDPTEILKNYTDSSMAVGLSLLSNSQGDAFISAGSTGGLVVGASFILKRIKGIKRPAIATIIPTEKSRYMLIDSGANHDCRPEMFFQFALMGSIYMEQIQNIKAPKIGILNIGLEESKGCELQKNAYQILKNSSLNFIGNIEAREIPFSVADVVVADGFVGNVILKYTEGVAKYFMSELKDILKKNILTKLAGSIIYGGLKDFKKKLDYTEHGGAIILGVKKPVIKAHGSSNAKAIKNAIKQAVNMVNNKTIDKISEVVSQYSDKNKG